MWCESVANMMRSGLGWVIPNKRLLEAPVPIYQCPECGNQGEQGVIAPEPYAFQVRGRLQGKHVYKCGKCGAGLRRCGYFTHRLATISTDTWTEMEREWEETFPNG